MNSNQLIEIKKKLLHKPQERQLFPTTPTLGTVPPPLPSRWRCRRLKPAWCRVPARATTWEMGPAVGIDAARAVFSGLPPGNPEKSPKNITNRTKKIEIVRKPGRRSAPCFIGGGDIPKVLRWRKRQRNRKGSRQQDVSKCIECSWRAENHATPTFQLPLP